jgi:hypothetical protein
MPKVSPAPFDAARAYYAEAFEPTTKRDLARSIAEWSQMDDAEQSFAVAHLLYLNLKAQAAGQRLVTQVRDLLDEVAEGLTAAIEASLHEAPAPPDEGPADDSDGFPAGDGPPDDVSDEPGDDPLVAA